MRPRRQTRNHRRRENGPLRVAAALGPRNVHDPVQYRSALRRRLLQQGLNLVQQCLQRQQQPFSGILPQELAADFERVDLERPLGDAGAALRELDQLYLRDAVYFHHPRYVAHLNCPVVLPALLAEVLVSSLNSSLDTWDQSAGGTLIEQRLIDWTCARIGLGSQADGVFTSGGTQSNLMGLLLAREHVCNRLSGHGGNLQHGLPPDAGRLRIFASRASHFSVQNSAALLGLGYDAVRSIETDSAQCMSVPALAQALADCQRLGELPMAVVATAGTTDFGSIDPLPEIAALCQHYGLWLHVDAAYGGGLLVAPRYRHWLAGIEHADSVTVDYHKSFFQPVSCSGFFVRQRQHLSYITHHADYLNPRSQTREGTPNLVNKSIQTTRRFDALKLWLTLRILGAEHLGAMFEEVIDRAADTHRLLADDPAFEVFAPRLSTLVFRFVAAGVADERLDEINREIRKAIFRSGAAVIAATVVKGRQYLKFTLLNPETTLDDLRAIVELIRDHGARLLDDRQPVGDRS